MENEYWTWIAQWQSVRGDWDSREFKTREEAEAFVRALPHTTVRTDVRYIRMGGTPVMERS